MRSFKRILSLVLILCIMFTTIPTTVLAYYAEKEDEITFTNSNGNSITTDSSWEQKFPYGTFAFSASEMTASEGGTSQKITVYRLGGTKGRAEAYISYIPAQSEIEKGVFSYANAAGPSDVEIRVEDTLPIAQYQALGKDPDPLEPESEVAVNVDNSQSTENIYAIDGVTVDKYGDISIYADVDAEAYQWYTNYGSDWSIVEGATGKNLLVSREHWGEYDFRCVFTAGGKTYCTNSANGEAYVITGQETLPEIPADLNLNPPTTYSKLNMDGTNSEGYIFQMTFAENEWKKDIIVTALDDDASEAEEFGVFTIAECKGGSLYDSANTLSLRVQDNEDILPSYLAFEISEITVDKAQGNAVLKVHRTGATQYVVSVDYATTNGSAIAGVDYAETSGKLYFYADIEEMTITVPLINDGIATEDKKTFTIELSNLMGGGNDALITGASATVNLYNSNTSQTSNVATVLHDTEAVDVSAAVTESENSITGTTTPIVAEEVAEKENSVFAKYISAEEAEDGISALTYNYPDQFLSFRNFRNDVNTAHDDSNYYYNNFWRDYAFLADESGTYRGYDVNDVQNLISNAGWTGGQRYGSRGWQYLSSGAGSINTQIGNMAQMFSSFKGYFKWSPKWASSWTIFWYGEEYTYPGFQILKDGGSFYNYNCLGGSSGNWFEGYSISYYPSSYTNQSWSSNSGVSQIQLYTALHDAHNADGNAMAALSDGILQRRYFSKDYLNLRIYTANDSDSAEANAPVLTKESGIYDEIDPQVTIKSGGVTSNGNIYVGSQLQVQVATSEDKDSFFVASGNKLTYAVYLTNSNGDIVKSSTGSGKTFFIDMLWSGMNLNDTYTVNVVMTRKQDIEVDLSPSVPRKVGADGAALPQIDVTKINVAAKHFWEEGKISYGYQYATDKEYEVDKFKPAEGEWVGTTEAVNTTTALTTLSDIENLQWICFNRPAADIVLFNGVAYAGNEKIYLTVGDLSLPKLTFRYYDSEYISAESIMTTSIASEGLYLDSNGNGQIDGYFNNQLKRFILTPEGNSYDKFISNLDDIDYEETVFAPVYSKDLGKYVQYYMKIIYTMTPRCLVVPAGRNASDSAQVLPAFMTNITDPGNYSQLTREQQGYRYIVSGKTRYYADNLATRSENDYAYSSDGHLMYQAMASYPTSVDIPLGGDNSPPVTDAAAGKVTWNPDYHGNLLYKFDNPQPIYIAHSTAGDNIPIAEIISVDASGNSTYEAGGVDKLNGYLGSYTANDTFSVCVQEQALTTQQILDARDAAVLSLLENNPPKPESSNNGKTGTFPSSEYLKSMNSGQSNPDANFNMDESGNEYDEFSTDFGIKLPSTNIGVSDYVTIIMDGYDVGFSIGLPLGSVGSENKGTGETNKDNAKKLRNFFSGSWSEFLKDDTYKPGSGDSTTPTSGSGGSTTPTSGSGGSTTPTSGSGGSTTPTSGSGGSTTPTSGSGGTGTGSGTTPAPKPGSGSSLKSSTFSVDFSMAMAFMFKYNAQDNNYYFSQFAISITANLKYRMQYRFTPVPIVYVYVTVGLNVTLTTGLTVERNVVEDTTKAVNVSSFSGKAGNYLNFDANVKTFNIYFTGKLVVKSTDINGNPLDDVKNGYITSGDINKPVTITLVQQDGYTLSNSIKVQLLALTDSSIAKIVPVTSAESNTYWNGFKLSPEVFIEAGVGIGVEMCKFEIFAKISVSTTLVWGAYAGQDTSGSNTYDFFKVDSFKFAMGLGFRVVLLLFNYEMDLIQYLITYDGATDKWQHGWQALGGMYGEMSDLSEDNSGVNISPPKSTANTQTIYSPLDENSVSSLAYDPSDPANVPFQLSGYSSSGDAFKLVSGLVKGYNYKVVSVGGNNYVIYTISRIEPVANSVDSSMLVMSKLKLVSTTEGDSYGLVNPVEDKTDVVTPTPAGAAPTPTPLPYIILDNDGTGDLEFNAWVNNNDIYAAWVSYATASDAAPLKPVKPVAYAVPVSADTTVMDESNYIDTTLFPAPADPGAEPHGPTPAPEPVPPVVVAPATEPVVTNYYTTDNTDPENPVYAPVAPYTTYLEAKGAYDTALLAYQVYDKYLLDYAEYQKDKTAYEDYLDIKAAYEIAKAIYDAAKAKYDAYYSWMNYFINLTSYNDYVQSQATVASKKTVVKTASFTAADTNSDNINDTAGFTAPATVTAGTGSNVFLPDGDKNGNVIFHAGSSLYSDSALAAANSTYKSYLNAIYGSSAMFQSTFTEYLYDFKVAENSIYGKSSTLNLSVWNGSAWVPSTPVSLAEGQLLQNMETTYAGTDASGVNKYNAAYTTSESHYINGAGEVITSGFDANSDLINISKFYLREVTVSSAGAVNWGTPYLLRTNVNYDRDNEKDGLYSGSTQSEKYEDPYFSNLQFLNGKLDSTNGQQTFLLFEMNGNTHVIPQSSLASITSSGTGTITPFFTNDQFNSATGKTEVTIGADGAGNISAVYSSSVKNTTNNALYVTKYDANTSSWGEGRMLAMNQMQVYEDSIAEGWTDDETEAAYYGKRVSYNHGAMNQFVFSNLQIALGQPAATNDPGTLLVLTEGTFTKLKDATYAINTGSIEERGSSVVGDGDGEVGFYAVSFGVGEQNIGDVSIKFADYDFTANSKLTSSIRFVNTGDVAIRGSVDNPAKVELWISGAPMVNSSDSSVTYPVGTRLDEWTVDKNIAVGQAVRLYGNTITLADTLPKGSVFYITVCEDPDYTTNGFSYSTLVEGGNLTVDEKAELAFEYCNIDTQSIAANGDTVLYADFQASNRGTKTAEDVYVQFSYQSGKDAEGKATYTPVDLYQKCSLSIGRQEELVTAQEASTPGEMQAGMLRLYNGEDGDDIAANYGRTVKGTITVPESYYYDAGITGSLNIKVEIFSKADTITTMNVGLLSADHNEYNNFNNAETMQIEHTTFFDTADKISVARGSTMKLPVSISTTTGTTPVITVEEMLNNSMGTEDNHLGILYYNAAGSYMEISPISEGNGFIRISDVNTNSFKDIAYTVTSEDDGINVFNDNDIFTFYNSEKTEYNPAGTGQDWEFKSNMPEWGIGDNKALPYLSNLSYATKDAYFTFKTVSKAIDLYFEGKVEVSSSFPGFTAKTVTSAGGKTYVTISFGENVAYYQHTVTVKVLSDYAQFDKYVEEFSGAVPAPADDEAAPQIFWNRSFPDTSSVDSDAVTPVTVTCYVIDETGLATVTADGVEPANLIKNDNSFWQFDKTLTSNGSFNIKVFDTAGNLNTQTVAVDWFNSIVSTGASADVPAVSAWFEYTDGASIPDTELINASTKAYLDYLAAPAPGDSTAPAGSVYYYNATSGVFEKLTAEADGRYAVNNNGYYRVIATAEDQSWNSVVLYMGRLDASIPSVTLGEITDDTQTLMARDLYYTVTKGKNSPSPITKVMLNGADVLNTFNQTMVAGRWDMLYGGVYTLYAEDGAANNNSTVYTAKDVVVNISTDGVFTVTDSWNQDRNNGNIAIDSSRITGGKYLASELSAVGTGYRGSYEYAIVASANAFKGTLGTQEADAYFAELSWQTGTAFNGLVPGGWTVYVKDAQEPDNTKVIAAKDLIVDDSAVVFSTGVTITNNPDMSNGIIVVNPGGGLSETGKYQFALVKVVDGDSALVDPSTITDWQEVDDAASLSTAKTYENVDTGWYQVVVRDKGLDYNNASYFDNAAIEKIYLGYSLPGFDIYIWLHDLLYSEGRVTVNLTSSKGQLSVEAERQLIQDNLDKEIIITGNGLYVRIPVGTLSAGDNISNMLVSTANIKAFKGDVVQYTDKQGKKHIAGFSAVTPGMVYYIASEPGLYEVVDNTRSFADITGHWAEENIVFGVAHEFFSGIDSTNFAPDTVMTRAMFVTVLGRLAGVDVSKYTGSIFEDAKAGEWYSPYVQWASEAGIVEGYGNDLFGSNDTVTREQMCVILARFLKYAGFVLNTNEQPAIFEDTDSISSWAKDAVELCQRAGLIQGVGNNNFDPDGLSTRAQVVTIFRRFIEGVVK